MAKKNSDKEVKPKKEKKPTKQKAIEETLWESANKLRGTVESAEYKHVVLSLIFLKFSSDKFEERKDKYLKNKVSEDQPFNAMKNVFYIPQEARWSYILKGLAIKYDFSYPEDKLIPLSQKVKSVVDDKAKYTDWSKRTDIKAELKAELIILLAENDYPPVDRDEVYKEIFEQAENFKKYKG